MFTLVICFARKAKADRNRQAHARGWKQKNGGDDYDCNHSRYLGEFTVMNP